MAGGIKYKNPKIVRAKKGWFVGLYYEYPGQTGKYKRFEISAGINYIHDLQEREKEAQILLKEVKLALQAGFDPFMTHLENEFIESIAQKVEAIKKVEAAEAEAEAGKRWTIKEGIKQFQEYCTSKNLSHNTIRTYDTFINNLLAWLEETEQTGLNASEVTEEKIFEFLNQEFDEEEWSPRTYNNHLRFFTTLFSRMEKLEKKQNKGIKYQIDLQDIEMKKDRAEKNRYYSAVVALKVKKELAKNESLYNYVKWIFYSCMRPREIRLLQINHIDIQARQIKAIAPTAKTGDRFIPICDELMALIKSMKLMKLPLNYYVFGGKNGKPGKERLSRDLFTNSYKLIKDKLGLDNKYTLYGWKHTRVVNLLMAGFTDAEVMSLTGHSDYQSFMAYKRELMVDTSAMKGKTIEF
ncbi:MAG: tyrosine-type recombinase/integrase [Prolixibacteraceae bacterium]